MTSETQPRVANVDASTARVVVLWIRNALGGREDRDWRSDQTERRRREHQARSQKTQINEEQMKVQYEDPFQITRGQRGCARARTAKTRAFTDSCTRHQVQQNLLRLDQHKQFNLTLRLLPHAFGNLKSTRSRVLTLV
jgi:hypothetical protein